ncbi:MAG: lyase family protein [Pseudomonadota bacterium]
MTASVFDSPLYARLFHAGEAARLFSDTAAIRAMLLVEGALAKVQGELGVIPELSAAAIHRASMEIQIDPGAIAAETGQNGVPIPGLVAAFRAEMNAPEHAQYVHWGATSQDIIDTGLMLRLRQSLALAEADLRGILKSLAAEAEAHATLPMAARTYGQQATPTSWGAVLAQFGMPLLEAVKSLDGLRQNALWVSLSGAAGTSAAFGDHGDQTRAALAAALGLNDPGRSWHTDRGPLIRIADWLGHVMIALGHMGQTLIGLCTTEVAEVSLGIAGASSTMPQKQNPVGPSALAALSAHFAGLRGTFQTAATHQHQRDGAAWFAEWLVIPQMVLCAASALQHAKALAQNMRPRPVQMRATLDTHLGLIHAEALSFALAELMPRPEAQQKAKALCLEAMESRIPLEKLARGLYPALGGQVFDPVKGLGQAPQQAAAFVKRVREL